MSLDDINLSETTCPEFIWRVNNFSHVMDNTPTNTTIFSPVFTSKQGYSFQMALYPNGTDGYTDQLSAFVHLVALEGETGQTWPCPWKQITMMLMDQHPHIQKRMSNQRSITTDPNMTIAGELPTPNQHYVIKQYILILHYFPTVKICCLLLFFWSNIASFFLTSTLLPSFQTDTDKLFFDDPRKVGIKVTHEDGSTYYRGPGRGTALYLTHLRAKSRDFIKGGDAIFLLTMEGKKRHVKKKTIRK